MNLELGIIIVTSSLVKISELRRFISKTFPTMPSNSTISPIFKDPSNNRNNPDTKSLKIFCNPKPRPINKAVEPKSSAVISNPITLMAIKTLIVQPRNLMIRKTEFRRFASTLSIIKRGWRIILRKNRIRIHVMAITIIPKRTFFIRITFSPNLPNSRLKNSWLVIEQRWTL